MRIKEPVDPWHPAPRAGVLRLSLPWRIFPALASITSISVGLLVLAGWFLEIEILKRAVPGFVAMNPMTALLFVVLGSALGLSLKQEPSHAARWVAKVATLAVLAIAIVKLVGLTAQWRLNVDQLLFVATLNGGPGDVPNRMAPNTAVNFALLALSLLSLNLPAKKFSLSQGFASLAGFCALLPITGYLYGVRSFTGLASFIPMALHTAVTGLLLAAGLFFARESAPLARLFSAGDSGGVIARRLFPLVVLVTIFLGWLRLEGERRGIFEAALGTALYAVTLSVLFVALILWTVWAVSGIEEERNSLNDALLENKGRLEETVRQTQLIIDHARELICTLDTRARILTVNAACDELLEIPSGRLVGRSFADVHLADEQSQIERALGVARSGLNPETFRARCRKGDAGNASLIWSIQWSPHYEKMFCVGRAA